ncbi:MAG: hypothetical protein E6K81_00290 [Candidatus Eisenbacteria bacterium]|uniref:Uncharacterized protein n=1 Tax=Eiseniibacteriota bacterium TaxID=2212470 RepID=A0A538UEH1_UNCEI|nr:MAG: hypothetical protein E6K81_00290 [Candidatus Eisenbacteria bacterium]
MDQKQDEGSGRRGAPKRGEKTTPSPPTPQTEDRLDESLDESFPASDPPAHSPVSHAPDGDANERGEG